MRFGKTLKAAIYPPWKSQYIDYGKLKRLLREDDASLQGHNSTAAQQWSEADEEAFVNELINVQLDKVNSFQVNTYKTLRDATSDCETKLEPVAATLNAGNETTDEHRKAAEDVNTRLDDITKQINELQKYSRINFTGFLKAAKKHDRKRGLKYRVKPLLQVRLSQLPFNSEDYSPLLYRLSTMYSFIRQVLHGTEESDADPNAGKGHKDTYTAHKFWVHMDDLLEVKTYILRRLPVLVYNPQSDKVVDSTRKDPAITSIYFDNPAFDLYSQKIDKAAEASSLRLRWTGQLNENHEITFEKKTVGEQSKEIRFPIKQKYIIPFLKGEYKMEKSISKVEGREGSESEYANTLKNNVEEIQQFIQENKLEPVLRASYTRTAFQIPGDDRVRVALDTDIAFIREDALDIDRPCRDPDQWHRQEIDGQELEYPFTSIKTGEISRFPYALLEVKIKEAKRKRNDDWLADLMSSHLVKEEPRFSKYVHGVAQLFEDYVNSFPFWLSDLDTDIRKDPERAFQEEQAKLAQRAEDEYAVGSLLATSKISASPSFKQKMGSPSKFADDGPGSAQALSQSRRSVSRAAQLEPTAEERDSDDDGVQRPQTQTGIDDSKQPSTLRSLFPAFSTSRYARRHRPGASAWKDADLPPGVAEPEYWIKDQGPVRVEAKVWLANQRTFVKWQHISVLLASLSIALYNAAGIDNNIARALAVVYLAFAAFAGIWGWAVYVWRSKLIKERSGKDFDHKLGPIVISVGLVVALCLNFGFKYQAVVREKEQRKADNTVLTTNQSVWR